MESSAEDPEAEEVNQRNLNSAKRRVSRQFDFSHGDKTLSYSAQSSQANLNSQQQQQQQLINQIAESQVVMMNEPLPNKSLLCSMGDDTTTSSRLLKLTSQFNSELAKALSFLRDGSERNRSKICANSRWTSSNRLNAVKATL